MAADLEEQRGARDADQVAELARDQLLDRVVVEVEELGLGRAADEDTHQHRARGCAAGELDAQERDGQDRSALDGRHHDAEAVERVLDLVAPVGHVDDDRRGVGNGPELEGQARVFRVDHPGRRVGLGGDDHGIGLEGRAVKSSTSQLVPP